MRKVSIVSTDGHAVLPAELWPDYLDRRFHEYLPALRADDEIDPSVDVYPLNDRDDGAGARPVRHRRRVSRRGLEGRVGFRRAPRPRRARTARASPPTLRVSRLLPRGRPRLQRNEQDLPRRLLVDAGARAHNRWAFDTFGPHADRFLLVGAIGTSGISTERSRRSTGSPTTASSVGPTPGFLGIAGTPALDDGYWDPFWARCAERDVAMIVHGGVRPGPGIRLRPDRVHVRDRSMPKVAPTRTSSWPSPRASSASGSSPTCSTAKRCGD